MKVLIVGYGRMGKAIESICLSRGHEISGKIDIDTNAQDREELFRKADIAIEFSGPNAAVNNISEAIRYGTPVVSGTTGWLAEKENISSLIKNHDGSLMYASNYSIGVNILFATNRYLAALMNKYQEYDVKVEEIHHIHKKDAPSGTAISLTDGIINNHSIKQGWSLDHSDEETIKIDAFREGEVFGDHKVTYSSPIDSLSISHSALTRDGFAIGAVHAAEWLYNDGDIRKGWCTMEQMMGL